ncbi:TPA: hypothetical protein NDS87_000330 [Enterobacter cloacae]|uniref:hypothetical protein n=1 Tax=Enterobacter cloacae complex TaxID=354276 RepID=UPI001C3F64CD|nr:hypothetical protein [Enterobacter cloacae]EMC0024486.1 hypothetical protein [Enterobacter cloacae]MCM8138290.1 hypothetical protein [Enterobacter cloacae]HAV2100740.1 hypothetical protein [Enterobacter cloacae]HBM8914616.1 hypothetical protein [Enterobacter cloacae]HCC5790312.1 hypothetical protein [Enterobacter cloacae]
MSGFGGSEFALCHKTFRQMMELSGKGCDAASMLACMAVLKLVSERYSDVKFNKRGVKFSEINNLLRSDPVAEILFYVSNHFSAF